MPTDLTELLRSRRSIRRFKPEPVPTPVIERLLETATYAPSAHNLQPWRFVVMQDREYRTSLGMALTQKMRLDMQAAGASETEIETRVSRSLRRLQQAPLAIVLCREVTAVKSQEEAERIMAIQSVALAGLQLLLAAHAEGLGGVWICWPVFAPEETHQALSLPDSWEAQAMIFLGYPDESPHQREKLPTSEIILVR
jgi:F420 biosynthesis protein FbiB-like protein